jgi:hypothetical protein
MTCGGRRTTEAGIKKNIPLSPLSSGSFYRENHLEIPVSTEGSFNVRKQSRLLGDDRNDGHLQEGLMGRV